MPDGNEVEDGLLAAHDQRVAGVVAALVAHDDLGVLGEEVDDLAFPFVAPLRADDDDVRHGAAYTLRLRRAGWQRYWTPQRQPLRTLAWVRRPGQTWVRRLEEPLRPLDEARLQLLRVRASERGAQLRFTGPRSCRKAMPVRIAHALLRRSRARRARSSRAGRRKRASPLGVPAAELVVDDCRPAAASSNSRSICPLRWSAKRRCRAAAGTAARGGPGRLLLPASFLANGGAEEPGLHRGREFRRRRCPRGTPFTGEQLFELTAQLADLRRERRERSTRSSSRCASVPRRFGFAAPCPPMLVAASSGPSTSRTAGVRRGRPHAGRDSGGSRGRSPGAG